jgi:Restriction endonuclease
MSESQNKGDLLEKAVQTIEKMILSTNPSLQGINYSVETKKILTIHGVKHEVDVFVSFKIEGGYDSIFLFECKNWEENVGKNEIIIFSEKIKAFNAQAGYFIAKSFGRYAKSQAKLDTRVKLVVVKDLTSDATLDLSPVTTKGPYFCTHEINLRKANPVSGQVQEIDLENAMCIHNGKEIKLKELIDSVNTFCINDIVSKNQEILKNTGRYPMLINEIIPFDSLFYQGQAIEKIEVKIKFTYINEPLKTTVIARFDVIKRGKYLEIEFEDPERGLIKVTMASKDEINELSTHWNGKVS